MSSRPLVRGGVAGLAGGVAWLAGIFIFFGSVQTVLGNPELQSGKMLEAFSPGSVHPPRVVQSPAILPVGLLAIGLLWGWLYAWIASTWPGSWTRRGVRFGLVAWVLMVPWFEFYLPWNVLREPAALAALEMICWFLVLQGVGLTIAGVEAFMRPRGTA